MSTADRLYIAYVAAVAILIGVPTVGFFVGISRMVWKWALS